MVSAPHPVRFTGLRASRQLPEAAPLIVKRTDQDFVAGLLADLASEKRRARLYRTVPVLKRRDAALHLLQPVQRVFHLALFEAYCDEPGQPRLDRSKIEGAGLVVRRLHEGRRLAWIKAGTRYFGWEAVDPEADPALDKRTLPFSVGHPFIDGRLASNRGQRNAGAPRLKPEAEVTEHVHPLFVAPPEVCAAAGKTVLFAPVPVTSVDQMEEPEEEHVDRGKMGPPPRFGSDADEKKALQEHLVHYLKAGGVKRLPRPKPDLDASWLELKRGEDDETKALSGRLELGTFILLLQQLAVEFDAFGDHPAAQKLFKQLNRIWVVRYLRDEGDELWTEHQQAGNFLRRAKAILLDNRPGKLPMPHRWDAVDEATARAIFEATLDCLDHQYRQLKPARGRFDDPDARYVVRAFIRLKPEHEGCPPRLLWSGYSAPFTIAPWYESGGAPPTTVPLPNLFKADVLKSLKPNVVFALPPQLARLLQADPKDLREGKGSGGSGEGGLGWLCGFSIPIITLCAFIVLNIFLQLLNLIFFWLPFLKICIPMPKGRPPGS